MVHRTPCADVARVSDVTSWRGRGCDAALRPCGRAAGGPRGAHRARTRGRRPRVSTQVHAGARGGCHVAGEVDRWRAHGYSGP